MLHSRLTCLHSCQNRYRQPILVGYERTDPAISVGTGGIIGLVEIERHTFVPSFAPCMQEITSFYCIKQIPPATIALGRASRIAEGQEQPAAVDMKPVY